MRFVGILLFLVSFSFVGNFDVCLGKDNNNRDPKKFVILGKYAWDRDLKYKQEPNNNTGSNGHKPSYNSNVPQNYETARTILTICKDIFSNLFKSSSSRRSSYGQYQQQHLYAPTKKDIWTPGRKDLDEHWDSLAFCSDYTHRQIDNFFHKLNDYQADLAPITRDGLEKSSLDIIKEFCSKRKYTLKWGTIEEQLKSAKSLENEIYKIHGLRKKYIRPLEKVFGDKYITNHLCEIKKNCQDRLAAIAKAKKELDARSKIKIKTIDQAKEVLRTKTCDSGLSKLSDKYLDIDSKNNKRVCAIAQAQKSNFYREERSYKLNSSTQKYIKDFIKLDKLQKTSGNAIQQNIHEEIIETINDASNLLNTKNLEETESSIIFSAADIALDFKDEKKYARAYSFSDFCSSLLTYVKKRALIAPRGAWKGVQQFSDSCRSLLDCFMYDPAGATADIINCVVSRIYEFKKQHEKILFPEKYGFIEKRYHFKSDKELCDYMRRSREIGTELLEKEWVQIRNDYAKLIEKISNDPALAAEDAIAFTTETVLTFGLWDVGIAKAQKLTKCFLQGVSNEMTCQIAKSNLKKESFVARIDSSPLTTLVEESSEIMRKSIEKNRSRNIIDTTCEAVGESTELVKAEGSYAKAVEKSASKPKVLTKKMVNSCMDKDSVGSNGKNIANYVEDINFASQEKLTNHFVKHKNEFESITENEYLFRARKLVSSNSGNNILVRQRSNGDFLFFDKLTGEFAVKSSTGFIRTFFKPVDGLEYFLKQ